MDALAGNKLALLSVTDKQGLAPFARGLVELGYTLLSTGGTAKLLREAGVPVAEVADYTDSPEILGGRVKTLHPKVHGGILFDRDDPAHVAEVARHGIAPIDLVVVNLYRFEAEAVARRLSAEDAIHHIDIGGPTMLRAAAKNWRHAAAVADPADYGEVLAALRAGGLPAALRRRLAAKTFALVASYDGMIASYLAGEPAPALAAASALEPTLMPERLTLALTRVQALRYGENPHQSAALYAAADAPKRAFASPELLSGKELSYNNLLDLDAATALAADLGGLGTVAVIVKHTNPCGVAASAAGDVAATFRLALAVDPKAAFGGIVALSGTVDQAAAEAVTSLFIECVAAPDYTPEALAVLRRKPALRVLRAPFLAAPAGAGELSVRSIRGALLVQQTDTGRNDSAAWRVVTVRPPAPATLADLRFAMIVAKHVKSNAIVFAKDLVTVAIGAGQMSRIDAANVAVAKALAEGRPVRGSVLASDAFFPFRDTVDFAAGHGVTAVVQPGGSKKDQDSVDAADEHGIAMVLTGERHFRH